MKSYSRVTTVKDYCEKAWFVTGDKNSSCSLMASPHNDVLAVRNLLLVLGLQGPPPEALKMQ